MKLTYLTCLLTGVLALTACSKPAEKTDTSSDKATTEQVAKEAEAAANNTNVGKTDADANVNDKKADEQSMATDDKTADQKADDKKVSEKPADKKADDKADKKTDDMPAEDKVAEDQKY